MVEHLAHDRLIAKLASITHLSAADAEALRTLPVSFKTIDPSEEIVRVGERSTRCCLLVEGFLFRYTTVPDGTRQILSLHIPGDIPDLQSLHLNVMDHSLAAMERSTVAFMSHEAIRELADRRRGIANALWRETLIDAAIYREWIANVGARSAYQRAAHLLCEVFYKLKAVGLVNGDHCRFPPSQQEMGDAMGLSAVHVNRTLQQLRGAGLIVLQQKQLTIPDWEALKRTAGFDPAYLHINNAPLP